MDSCCETKSSELSVLRAEHRKVLIVVLIINAVLFVVEAGAGLLAHSTALLADSLDMLGDSLVYGFSLYVLWQSADWRAMAAVLKGIVMSFSELADLVAQNVENAGGGIISRGAEQLTIRAVSRVNNVEDIANLPLKFGAGVTPLLVKDVAEVKTGTKFRTGAATLNGHEAVIGTTMDSLVTLRTTQYPKLYSIE